MAPNEAKEMDEGPAGAGKAWLLVDGHLDLALAALEWHRDLTQPLDVIRAREAGWDDRPDRGKGVVCFPEMRRGGVMVCLATQIARVGAGRHPHPAWPSAASAWAMTQGQLAWYRVMEETGELRSIRTREDLDEHVRLWQSASPARRSHLPIGYVLSLEGADSILSPRHLEQAYEEGLRAVGLAHYGPGIYAAGTSAEGGLTERGRDLLPVMEALGLALDVTHLTDAGFWEALDRFDGTIWASHHNCRHLVPHPRQLTDEQIRAVIERDGVIGVALDAWMLTSGWQRGVTTPQQAGVTLETVADHIDHICQIAGNARHAALGTDLDGCFGYEQTPSDVRSIADVRKLASILARRGYGASDIECILSGNWLRKLRAVLPSCRTSKAER